MSNIFLISDWHLGHDNILTFCKDDGTLLRPEFDNVEQMNEYLIEKNNAVVRPQDHLYMLGDVAINAKFIPLVAKFNGHKRLVLGNHDHSMMKLYTPYFEKVFSTRRLDKFILSHIPLHPESLGNVVANIHGHVHNNVEQGHFGPRYYNVSCEVLNYVPISLEELKVKVDAQQET